MAPPRPGVPFRARLATPDLKDLGAQGVANYAGPSWRFSQRSVVSKAARRRRGICAEDAAFLQRGRQQGAGRSRREALGQLPGRATFDAAAEFLRCEKPGAGCSDARRRFLSKFALVPSTVDAEQRAKYQRRSLAQTTALQLLVDKCVDDLARARDEPETVGRFQQHEGLFGKLAIERNTFATRGAHCARNPTAKEATLD
eukprot:15460081-Alexandrium_andersonii.AAC.1